jgi:hypothetical protein
LILPNKTIYVREADTELWEEAEQLAGGNVSGLIADALRRYVDEEKRREQGMGKIDLDLSRGKIARKVWFEGRWLVEPDEDKTRPADPAGEAGFYYGVALTKRGNIAVYINSIKPGGDPRLDTYPSLDAAAVEGLPEDIYEKAEAVMDRDFVEELDI